MKFILLAWGRFGGPDCTENMSKDLQTSLPMLLGGQIILTKLPRAINLEQYILQFRPIHLGIRTNTLGNLDKNNFDKYILEFRQIYYAI